GASFAPSLATPARAHPLLLPSAPCPEAITLSLHDALPIYRAKIGKAPSVPTVRRTIKDWASKKVSFLVPEGAKTLKFMPSLTQIDRKSTRLNSSHVKISYAVFCLKKKTIKSILLSTSTRVY